VAVDWITTMIYRFDCQHLYFPWEVNSKIIIGEEDMKTLRELHQACPFC